MFVLGWVGFRKTKNLSDYILGGRRLGKWVTALSAGASDMSGWLLMGLPGAIYISGISGIWIAIGLILGAWFNWRFVASRLRSFTEKCRNAMTIPDYLDARFQDKTHLLRIVAVSIILIFFTIYCASGVVASAKLFHDMFAIPYRHAVWIGAVATICYVFLGGFLAVSWTDTVQASLVFTALILVPLMIIHANGGLTHSVNILAISSPAHLDIVDHLSLMSILSMLGWGLGYFGQPHILVRFMAAKSAQTIPGARRISITWMTMCLFGAISIGFFGYSYFSTHPQVAAAVMANPEMVFIESAKQFFNPWIAGFLLAAILAAIMSTLSCQLLVCSSALTEDIYKTFLHRNASQRELVWFGRLMVLIIAGIAIWIARDPDSKVLQIVSYAWAGFGAAFGPLILLSLLWPRLTRNGALAGMMVGSVTVLVWKQFAWFQLYEIVPGFIFATLAAVIVSLFSRPPIAIVDQLFTHENEGPP